MHSDINDEEVLRQAGVRLTAVRLLVWRNIRHGFSDAFSLADLESKLPTVDRSTLFRTLTILADAHLLHETDDGSGSQKYCLTNVHIPSVPLPEGFDVEETEYVVKGYCPNCQRRHLNRS